MKHFALAAVAALYLLPLAASAQVANVTCPATMTQAACDAAKEGAAAAVKALEDGKSVIETGAGIVETLNDPAKVQEWVDLGANIGKALSSAAKELGTGVQEFAKTDVGYWVTVLILWQLIGKSIILLGFTFFFMAIMNAVFLRMFWKMRTESGVWDGPIVFPICGVVVSTALGLITLYNV